MVYFVNLNSMEIKRLTDEEYKFIFERVPRLCLDFVVVKDGKVLLAKRDIQPSKGLWALPGGMVRYGESVNDATDRIIKGELGCKILEKNMVGFMEFLDEINKDGIHVHSISIVFLAKLKDNNIVGSEQAKEVRFFELLPKDIHKEHGKFLKENWDKIIK